MRSVVATKRDLECCATKQDLEGMNSNLISRIDGFVGIHKGLDLELVSSRSNTSALNHAFSSLQSTQV